MIDFGIAQTKKLFFDSKKVIEATSRPERKVLSKFGAYVRQSARSSIRKRKRASPPGEPPSSHKGLLRQFIWFAYEPTQASVVIGPARLGQKIGDAPRALEYGGRSRVAAGRRRNRRVVRTATIRARPFMRPAFEKERPKLPAMWRDSIRT